MTDDLISRAAAINALRDWQLSLNRQRSGDTAIAVGMAADLIENVDAVAAIEMPDPAAIREAALREAIALPKYAPTNYGAMSPAERGCWVHTGEIFALIEKGAADGLV